MSTRCVDGPVPHRMHAPFCEYTTHPYLDSVSPCSPALQMQMAARMVAFALRPRQIQQKTYPSDVGGGSGGGGGDTAALACLHYSWHQCACRRLTSPASALQLDPTTHIPQEHTEAKAHYANTHLRTLAT